MKTQNVLPLMTIVVLSLCLFGQTSSLYLQVEQEQPFMVQGRVISPPLSPQLQAVSLIGVPEPPPREFAVNDLVEIIIREATEVAMDSSLETDKGVAWDGEIRQFPQFQLQDLLNAQIMPGDYSNNPIALEMFYANEFDGEGDYERSDSVVGRVQARITDVKPNGTLVLEARKFIKSDDEELELLVTGTCRAEDIAVDNTILSTKLYDLHLNKMHKGELRKTTKKGLFTQLLDFLFNF